MNGPEIYCNFHSIKDDNFQKEKTKLLIFYQNNESVLKSLNVWSKNKKNNSNALENITRRLIGQRQKFATIYFVIYCR